MKRSILTILALFVLTFLGCANNGTRAVSSLEGENFDRDASYALGMNIWMSLAEDGIVPNMEEFIQGMMDSIAGTTRMDIHEAMFSLQMAFMQLQEARNHAAMEAEEAFLAENALNPDITVTASGLQFQVLEEGSGPRPSAFNTVRVHYEGRLVDGTVFDSSFMRGEPVEFPLDQVIPGWTEGLQLMNVGSKYRFYIPSHLGYGPRGVGPIPGFATLIFDVELLAILD